MGESRGGEDGDGGGGGGRYDGDKEDREGDILEIVHGDSGVEEFNVVILS